MGNKRIIIMVSMGEGSTKQKWSVSAWSSADFVLRMPGGNPNSSCIYNFKHMQRSR